MTAESTISFSHFHGARSAPATTSSSVVLRWAVERAAVLELFRLRFDAREAGDGIVCRHGGLWCARGLAGVRHLSERQVFGEPDGRQPLDRAPEDGQERPAAGMWTAGAALEPAWNAGAIEGVFEQPDVVRRCCAAPPRCDRSGPRRAPPARCGARFRRTRGPRRAPRTRAPRRSARVRAAAGRRTGCGGAP